MAEAQVPFWHFWFRRGFALPAFCIGESLTMEANRGPCALAKGATQA